MVDKNEKHILIIEDDEDLGGMILKGLDEKGYTVQLVLDGKKGFDQIDLFSPDLILLDLTLPNMSGYEILEKLNKRQGSKPVPPVIIISNSGEPVEVNKILTLGAKDYLIKVDLTPNEVVRKVEAQLELSSADTEENILRDKDFRVLVVEDDNFLRDLLSRKLTHEKLNLLVAADGEEGLELATTEHPSIILLDLILPGMNGFEVLTAIRKNPETKNIPVIILSNLGQESDIEKAKKIGADEFLIKANFSIDEVITKMKNLIQSKNAEKKANPAPVAEEEGAMADVPPPATPEPETSPTTPAPETPVVRETATPPVQTSTTPPSTEPPQSPAA